MIIKKRTFSLFGKEVLNKISVKPPYEAQSQMLDEACLLYVLDGEPVFISETAQLTGKRGEAILQKCGIYLNKIYATKKNSPNEFITIHFHPEILKEVFNDELPDVLKPSRKSPLISNMTAIRGNAMIKKFFDSLLFYFEYEELIDDEILKLKIKELILLLIKTQNDQEIASILANLFTLRAYNLKEIVSAHVYTTTSIDQLAKLCALSRSSFIRDFKKEYRQTPAAYIKNKKLERAADLLTYSSESIGTIAYSCGFNNSAHFSRSFYIKYKDPPSKYRLKQTDK